MYEHTGHYSPEDGVSEAAIAIWEVLAKVEAYSDTDSPEAAEVADRVIEVLQSACTV